jgi:nucleoside-diphosphate-sugar epimerase
MIFQLIEALQTSRVLKVSGTDTSRDWTHANDVSTAIDALLFAPTLHHLVYNVSCGIATNARTILAHLIDRGLQVTWEQDITIADLILDPSHNRKPLIIDRLQADTGFSPRLHLPSSLTSLLRPAIR